MGELRKKYDSLKAKDKNKIYIFVSGGTFNYCLEDDARKVNEVLGFKLTNLGNDVAVGLPAKTLDKYIQKFKENNINFSIISKGEVVDNVKDFLNNNDIINILNEIRKIDMNKISPMDAFNKLFEYQNKLKNIKEG